MLTRSNSFYYARLSTKEKAVYKTIRTGIESFTREIQLPPIPINRLSKIFDCILRDNPLIFYVTSFNVTSDSQICLFYPYYKYAPHVTKSYINETARYMKAFDGVKSGTELEKEMFVHDFCLDNFKYDYSFGEHAYSALGLVLNGAAVCEGIAKFAKLALDYLGVKNMLVRGKANDPVRGTYEEHAWNIVEIAGEAFHLDITFNMCQKTSVNRYDYFNLCDEEIKKDHSFTNDLPKCITPDKDYYTTHGMVVNSPKKLGIYVEKRLKSGEKCIIVKLRNVNNAADILEKVLDIAQRQCVNVFNQSGLVEARYNPSQMVFEIEYGGQY